MNANRCTDGFRSRSSRGVVVWLKAAAALWWIAALAGCETGTLPDPNDPRDVGLFRPDDARQKLKATSDFLNWRRMRGEINESKEEELIARRANELLKVTDLNHMDESQAWQYAEIYIAARRWEAAKEALELAVRHPADPWRRSLDNLRLARVLAELGQIPEAIEHARLTFICRRDQAAPILPAVLLEIVPAGQGKGHDVDLAMLLMDSVAQEERVVVEPERAASKAFLQAKPFHIQHAYRLAIKMLQGASRPELANKARAEYDAWKATEKL